LLLAAAVEEQVVLFGMEEEAEAALVVFELLAIYLWLQIQHTLL
jgi:hypothetical protein